MFTPADQPTLYLSAIMDDLADCAYLAWIDYLDALYDNDHALYNAYAAYQREYFAYRNERDYRNGGELLPSGD